MTSDKKTFVASTPGNPASIVPLRADERADFERLLSAEEWLRVRDHVADALKPEGACAQEPHTRWGIAEKLLREGLIDAGAVMQGLYADDERAREREAEAKAAQAEADRKREEEIHALGGN